MLSFCAATIVNFLARLQPVLHEGQGLVGLPVGGLLDDDLEAGALEGLEQALLAADLRVVADGPHDEGPRRPYPWRRALSSVPGYLAGLGRVGSRRR